MESMTVQVLLGELESARESLDRAFACLLPAPIFSADLDTEELFLGTDAARNPTIKVVTENGFSIERTCEREESKTDSASACHFVVTGPNLEDRRVIVTFSQKAVRLVQSSQGPTELALSSAFWLLCAECHLAKYLWEKNDCPPDGRLLVDQP